MILNAFKKNKVKYIIKLVFDDRINLINPFVKINLKYIIHVQIQTFNNNVNKIK